MKTHFQVTMHYMTKIMKQKVTQRTVKILKTVTNIEMQLLIDHRHQKLQGLQPCLHKIL